MKTIIILIALFISTVAYSQTEKQYTFQAGDTATTWSVSNAKVCYFTIRDSSMTGTDSIYIAMRFVHSSGVVLNSVIALKDLAQTTMTTFVASSLLTGGDNTTKTFVFYPSGVSGGVAEYTGSFTITRLNGVNAATPYTPKTRLVFQYQ